MRDDSLFHKAKIEQDAGRHDSAATLLEILVAQHPRNAKALHHLGKSRLALGQFAVAGSTLDAALALDPRNASILIDRADALRQTGDHAAAIERACRGLALDPLSAHGYIVRAAARWALNLRESALADIQRAVVLRPLPSVRGILGLYLLGCQRPKEALVALEDAMQADPDNAVWHKHIGDCHTIAGDFQAAFHAYHKAVVLDQRYAEGYCDLSGLLIKTASYEMAKSVAQLAIQLKPALAEAHYSLGVALQMMGQEEDAIAAYRDAMIHKPHYPNALVNICILRGRNCDWHGRDDEWSKVRAQTYRIGFEVPPFSLIATADDPSEHLICARVTATAKTPTPMLGVSAYKASAQPRRTGRLRIGYLSADFHAHATAHLISEHFEHHDRARFEIFGYSIGIEDGSTARARIRQGVDAFVDLRNMPHEAAAERIKSDGIDILIDLKGHTLHARPEILAYRPAPIQVNFLGYPGTMGADYIDYVIADPIVLPMDQQVFYDERIVHLPNCYQPNDRHRPLPRAATPRVECGLPQDAFVYCCFNYAYKIAPEIFAIWMRILKGVPNAVIWLLDSGERVADNLRLEAARQHVDPNRLIFAKKMPLAEHLARVASADLLLDTLPYNAHTTASDALWVGVPVLTCMGRSFASRVAASLLAAVDLPGFIVGDLAAYEAEAIRLALFPVDLAHARDTLTANRMTTALFDTNLFTRHFEAALDEMGALHEAGRPPQPFVVKSSSNEEGRASAAFEDP